MAKTRGAGSTRQVDNSNRRITRSSTRTEPPLVISEPPNEPRRASTRQTRASQKRKGKGKAIATEKSDSDDEELRNALFESRQMAENEERLFGAEEGEPSAYTYTYESDHETLLDDTNDPTKWFNTSETEADYLYNEKRRKQFQDLLDTGYSRRDSYIAMERAISKHLENAVRRKCIKE